MLIVALFTIMANLNKEDILSEYGGVIESSFCTNFDPNLDPDDDLNPSTPLYPRSEFLHPDDVVSYLENNKHNFTIFNLNVDSIRTKYNQLLIFMEFLLSKNLSFSAITIQEARLVKELSRSEYNIPGYNKFSQERICSSRGGLITHINKDFIYIRIYIDHQENRPILMH